MRISHKGVVITIVWNWFRDKETNGRKWRVIHVGPHVFVGILHMMKKYYQFMSKSTEKVAYLHGKTLNLYKANY